jgi:hypothetical protein
MGNESTRAASYPHEHWAKTNRMVSMTWSSGAAILIVSGSKYRDEGPSFARLRVGSGVVVEAAEVRIPALDRSCFQMSYNRHESRRVILGNSRGGFLEGN